MAAHRYWKASYLAPFGTSGLELSCFHLIDMAGARLDAPAALTSNTAPTSGALANLQDDDLGTLVAWAHNRIPGLSLSWDFGGGPAAIFGVQLAGVTEDLFLSSVRLSYSDNGTTWVDAWIERMIAWPGAMTKTASLAVTGAWSTVDQMPTGTRIGLYDDLGSTISSGPWSLRGAVGVSSGTVQFEVDVVALNSRVAVGVGIPTAELTTYPGGAAGGWGYLQDGSKYLAGAYFSTYGATYTAGDTIGVVVNFTTGSLTFYKNGVSQGAASATGMLGLTLHPMAASLPSDYASFRLRGDNFKYPIGGASAAWSTPQRVALRAHPAALKGTEILALGALPPIPTYGEVKTPDAYRLTAPDGSIKDFVTGVLGTGRGRVQGTVKETGSPNTPVYRRVRLYRDVDGLLIREAWSHPITGAYSFDYVDELQKFTVLSYDHTGAFRAVVADGQVPELIP